MRAVNLLLDGKREDIGDEGYRFVSAKKGITISAASPGGLFYGIQTMRQLMKQNSKGFTVTAVSVTDYPRFRWRGYLLDPARHFRTKDEIKRYIDLIALCKMNIMQLHLTDDQGWRIEMPGHSLAATSVYPHLGCEGKPASELCVSKEITGEFSRNVLTEVISLFSSPYVHVGADEVQPDRWRSCPSCSRRIKDMEASGPGKDLLIHNVKVTSGAGRPYHADISLLQGWYNRGIDNHIAGSGRRMVGWDEIMDGGLDNNISLERTYSFDPVPAGLSPEEKELILGVQGNMWGESTPTVNEIDERTFPRLAAIAETGWAQTSGKNFEGFSARIMPFMKLLQSLGVNSGT
jgi:hexosaminidase